MAVRWMPAAVGLLVSGLWIAGCTGERAATSAPETTGERSRAPTPATSEEDTGVVLRLSIDGDATTIWVADPERVQKIMAALPGAARVDLRRTGEYATSDPETLNRLAAIMGQGEGERGKVEPLFREVPKTSWGRIKLTYGA